MWPKRLGFPSANKMLRLLEFPCKCQFLVPFAKWVEVEVWEMGLKDFCNKSWEMLLQCDRGLHSLLCECVFNFMKDLFPIMFSIVVRKQGTCSFKKKNNQKSQLKVVGTVKDEIDGSPLCSGDPVLEPSAKEMHTPCES